MKRQVPFLIRQCFNWPLDVANAPLKSARIVFAMLSELKDSLALLFFIMYFPLCPYRCKLVWLSFFGKTQRYFEECKKTKNILTFILKTQVLNDMRIVRILEVFGMQLQRSRKVILYLFNQMCVCVCFCVICSECPWR